MDYHFKLRYFPVRGRCEPILLVLEDAALSYSLDEVKLEQWIEAKKSGTVNPPFTPFQGLPVLEVYNVSSPTSPTIILGETPTILRFLDDHIAHRRLAAGCRRLSAVSEPDCSKWSNDMMQDASLFFLNRVFQLTASKDWLAEPQRGILWERIVQPFLNSAGHYLSIGNIGALDATTPLTGPIAAVFTAISFCFDIFPHLHAGGSGTSQPCLELYDRVRTRPAIESWYSSQSIASKPWTLSEYGTASWISDAARKSTL